MRRTCLFALGLAACSPELGPSRSAVLPIIGGTADRGDPAIAALATYDGTTMYLNCTATLIAPKTLLSAAHCAEPPMQGEVEYAIFGDALPQSVDATAIAIARRVPHPAWNGNNEATDVDDISVYELVEAITHITPIELYEVAPLGGESIRHVGFGATTAAQITNDGSGTKREVTTTVRRVEAQLEVGGTGRGHCYGDSGGPGLIVAPGETRERVEGVVSWGTDDCLTEAWDTRVDTHVAWIRQTMGAWEPVTPPPLPPPPDAGVAYDGGATPPSKPDAGFETPDAGEPPVEELDAGLEAPPADRRTPPETDLRPSGSIHGQSCSAVGGSTGDALLFSLLAFATIIAGTPKKK